MPFDPFAFLQSFFVEELGFFPAPDLRAPPNLHTSKTAYQKLVVEWLQCASSSLAVHALRSILAQLRSSDVMALIMDRPS